jgi:hypothetical protein
MRLLSLEHWLYLDLATDTVTLPKGRSRQHVWSAVKRVYRLPAGWLTVFKIVMLHLILNFRGVPHRISLGETVEDGRDSSAMD